MPHKLLTDETFRTQMEILNKNLSRLTGYVNGADITTFAQVSEYVREGIASTLFSVGDQFETEKVKNITATVGNSSGITAATVDMPKFIEKLGIVKSGVFELTFNGAAWHTNDFDAVSLAEYGITTTGIPAENDKIAITITTSVLPFDILDFDKYNPKSTIKNCIVLGMHDIVTYGSIQFSASQLLYYAQDGLPAGKYKLTLDHGAFNGSTAEDGTYMFTLTKAIPAGGGFRHSKIGVYDASYSKDRVVSGTFATYGVQPERAEVESGIATALWDGSDCIDLGTFADNNRAYYEEDASIVVGGTTYKGKRNVCGRQAYGTNRWRDSVYRQWLNSDAPAVASGSSAVSNWWKPATVFDRVPSGAKLAGFLYGMDPDFVKALGEVEVKTALHQVDKVDGATFDITLDKIFLQSRKDIFGSDEFSGVSEGEQLEYWKGAENADRIKYWNNTPSYWWMRTPYSTFAGYVRRVDASGVLSYNCASDSYGVVPACCICSKQTITNG